MSAPSCETCGNAVFLSERCANCEHINTRTVATLAPRLVATREALREAGELQAIAVKSLGLRTAELLKVQAAHENATAQLTAALALLNARERHLREMSTENARLRKELYIVQRGQQDETKRRRRAKAELNLLRDKVAEYEKPIDELELAELMHYVESEHAAFDAAQRGDGPDGFAGFCSSCETLILAIRKMRAAVRTPAIA